MKKQKLLMLHGAIGSSSQFKDIAELLKEKFDPVYLDFPGHGGRPITEVKFSIPFFAEELLSFIRFNNLSPANIFGYSMGGYVALYIARHNPNAVKKVMTLATKFDWNEEGSIKEAAMLNPEKIKEKLPEFANLQEKRHAPQDWKVLLNKTSGMMLDMGKEPPLKSDDLALIQHDVLVTVGDRDKMVSLQETEAAFSSLKNGKMLVFPETPHPIEQVNNEKLVQELETFFLPD